MGRWGDGEMGEMVRWGDGEMGRWGDGEMVGWGDDGFDSRRRTVAGLTEAACGCTPSVLVGVSSGRRVGERKELSGCARLLASK